MGKIRFGTCPCCQKAADAAATSVPPPPAPWKEEGFVCECGTVPSPGSDFFQFVNAEWLQDESITIPPEYPRWGSFIKLVDEALKNQIGILKDLVGGSAKNPDEEKIATIWGASMERFAGWEAGTGDYTDLLSELEHLKSALPCIDDSSAFSNALADYFGRCQEVGITCPLAFGKEANLQDTENIVLDLSPNGTSLPSRDYYVDDKFLEQRGWFREHLTKVLELVGAEKCEDDFVNRVIRLETKIAQVSMKKDQSRQFDQYFTVTTLDDVIAKPNDLKHYEAKEANYSDNNVDEADTDKDVLTTVKWTVNEADLASLASFWERLFGALKLREVMVANYAKNYPDKTDAAKAQYRLMVFDGDYFRRALPLLLRKDNQQDVRAYLQYQIIKSSKDFCTKALNEEFFDFYSRKLGGQQEQKTNEKRTINLINTWAGELMGKVYVSRFFSEEDKNTVRDMVKDVLDIMAVSLKENDWLTEETKAKAAQKLAKFVVKLGYPDKWKNFDSLDLKPEDSMFVMQQKVNRFEHETEFVAKINTVKDKTKWEMNPQDVNAYFHPLNNEIVFPAAIMQPPFYSRSLDTVDFDLGAGKDRVDAASLLSAINFGGIGAVIAHEITHGYDDQGRKFDSDGNINDWWQEQDANLFKAKCALMAEQAEKWTFEDKPEDNGETKTHRMNAELTMGENLADLGGMSLACQALQKRFGSALTKDHFVGFFSSWGNVWKSKETKAFTIQALATDTHAPCSFRGNLVKNVDKFYETFDLKEGDSMYLAPEKRVKMW